MVIAGSGRYAHWHIPTITPEAGNFLAARPPAVGAVLRGLHRDAPLDRVDLPDPGRDGVAERTGTGRHEQAGYAAGQLDEGTERYDPNDAGVDAIADGMVAYERFPEFFRAGHAITSFLSRLRYAG